MQSRAKALSAKQDKDSQMKSSDGVEETPTGVSPVPAGEEMAEPPRASGGHDSLTTATTGFNFSGLEKGLASLTSAMLNLSGEMGQMSSGLSKNMAQMTKLSSNLEQWQSGEGPFMEHSDVDEVDDFSLEGSSVRTPSMPKLSPISSQKRPAPEEGEGRKASKFLQKMNAEAAFIEPKGPKITEGLADNITAFMRSRPEESKLKELYDELPVPENCPGLEKILVNEDIWSRIPPDSRSSDLKLQRVQTALVKGVTALSSMCDVLLQNYESDLAIILEKHFEVAMDFATKAFKAFGAANFEISMRRRENLKSTIANDFVHLCAPSVPFTDKLFGDDVTKVIKDISDHNRLNKRAFQGASRRQPRGRFPAARGYSAGRSREGEFRRRSSNYASSYRNSRTSATGSTGKTASGNKGSQA